jgi:Alginate export
LEPFVLWRVAPSVGAETAAETKTGRLDEQIYGFRWKGRAITDLYYSFEAVWERGSAGKSAIHAAGTTFGAAYRASRTLWKPRVFSQYDYASGDKNPKDNVQSTFDTIYPTAHDRFGISDQFGWQNIEAARAGVTIEPRHRWTVTVQYLYFWLASATDALYNTSGVAIVRDTPGRWGRNIGGEIDAYTWYELNRRSLTISPDS